MIKKFHEKVEFSYSSDDEGKEAWILLVNKYLYKGYEITTNDYVGKTKLIKNIVFEKFYD